MKRFILLSVVLVATLACSFSGSFDQNPTSESESNNPTQPPNLPTQPSINPTPVDGVVSPGGNMQWSLLYNPTNVNSYYDLNDYSVSFLGGGTIPMISGEFRENSENLKVLFSKGYAYDRQTVYVPSDLTKVTSVDLETGNINWQSDMQGYIIGLGENTIFVYRDDNRIYGLEKSNGEEKWHIILDALVADGELAEPYLIMLKHMDISIIPMMMTCFGGHSFRFLYINESTGDNYLSECNPGFEGAIIPLAYLDGMIIAKSRNGRLFYGVNVEDGSIRWRFGEGYEDYSKLEIAYYDHQEKSLYILADDGWTADLIAINATSGSMIWGDSLAHLHGLSISEFTPGFESNNLYITGSYIVNVNESQVMVFRKEDGALINTITPDRSFKAFISDSGMILYFRDLGVLKGVDYLTGEELWLEDELTIYGWSFHSWYVDDIIMLRDDANDLFAINQKTGDYLWSLDISGDHSFAVYDDNMIYYDGENLIFKNVYTGDTQELFIDEYGYMLGNGGHIEILDDSSWLLCGVYLTRVSIR